MGVPETAAAAGLCQQQSKPLTYLHASRRLPAADTNEQGIVPPSSSWPDPLHLGHSAAHQHQHGTDQVHAPLRLDALPVIRQVGQQLVIGLVEELAGGLLQHGVDVTGAGRVLASLQPCAKLACRAYSSIFQSAVAQSCWAACTVQCGQ